MKKLIILLVFIAAISSSYAQPVIITCDAVKVVYRGGVENPVTFHVDHYKSSELNVKVSTGTIVKSNDSGSYNWKICDSQDKFATIYIYCHKQFIKSIKFHLRRIPNPIAHIGADEGCRSGGTKLQDQKGVRADLKDFVFEGIEPNVMSYHITVKKAIYNGIKDTVLVFDNIGAAFNPPVKKIIESLSTGDEIMFDKIKVQIGCESRLREINNIIYNIY